jgi:hypothetical protein
MVVMSKSSSKSPSKSPAKPWVHLLDPDWQAWRETQFMIGQDPDSVLEKMLQRAGKLPSNPGHRRAEFR